MTVLVLAQITNGALDFDATARTVAATSKLGDVNLLCIGSEIATAIGVAATIQGVSKVLYADAPVLAHQLAEPTSALIVSIAAQYDHIAAPATTDAKNILPRVAALLDVMMIQDVSGIVDGNTFERPVYAGSAIHTVVSEDAIKVLSIRISAFEPASSGAPVPVEALSVPDDPKLSIWVEDRVNVSDRPALTSARIVVSGGRGVGSRENFKIIEALAGKLNAAVGASRAAVDAGYASNDWQVGQTGKIVAPDLYIAVGISGAIQHLAGMKESKIIVAINKDSDAPIFQVADYGLVMDLFDALPEMIQKLDGYG